MKKVMVLYIISALFIASCDLSDLFDTGSGTPTTGLSENDIITGLKEALVLGSKTAAFTLGDTSNTTNALGEITGYLANELVKIMLPEDAQKAFTTINLLNSTAAGKTLLAVAGIDLTSYREAIIRGLNRGAEYAAPLSVDVFKEAITDMTFTSAKEILFGTDSTGATNYLRTSTSDVLTTGFEPIIDSSFGSVKVTAFGMQYSVKSIWSEFAVNYNKVANSYQSLVKTSSTGDPISAATATATLNAVKATGVSSIDPVNTDIVEYATGKALDGLFYMVGKQELKIRRDPVGALTAAGDFITNTVRDIIEKVFTAAE